MKTVTVDEARENLPELLRSIAAGEEVVITDGGKWVAALTQPPDPPPTPEEEAVARAQATEAVRSIVRQWIEAGHPPGEGSPLWELLDEGR